MDAPVVGETGRVDCGTCVRILVVEDHSILRAGLRALLEIEPDLRVVEEAANAEEAEAALERTDVDLVLTDLSLPTRSGAELIRSVHARRPSLRFVVLTAHGSEEHIRAALAAGAHGYVLKECSRANLVDSIRTVAEGGQFLCPAVSERILNGFVHPIDPRDLQTPQGRVTSRERQVLALIAEGRPNKMIAHFLGVSVKTVEKHRFNVMHKLSLRNAASVTRFAMEHGLVAPPDDSLLEGSPAHES
jgi:DNA-binding NarL/FixJ family response regulator